MAIDMDLVELRLSVAAAAGNTTASTAAASFGDQVSTTDVESGDLNNLWPDVSSATAAAGAVEYRCVFLANTDTETLIGAEVSVTSQVSGGSTLAIGLDPIGVTAIGSASAQATTIANGTSAPAGVSFSTGPLTIGDLDTNEAVAVWVRRTTTAGAVPTTDAATLLLNGDSMP
jgi:hypothetical protein